MPPVLSIRGPAARPLHYSRHYTPVATITRSHPVRLAMHVSQHTCGRMKGWPLVDTSWDNAALHPARIPTTAEIVVETYYSQGGGEGLNKSLTTSACKPVHILETVKLRILWLFLELWDLTRFRSFFPWSATELRKFLNQFVAWESSCSLMFALKLST